jgi:hypothetical protein
VGITTIITTIIIRPPELQRGALLASFYSI